MLIDIGVNLSNSQYKNDVDDVLMRAQEAGVKKMVLTGTSIAESDNIKSGFPRCFTVLWAFTLMKRVLLTLNLQVF